MLTKQKAYNMTFKKAISLVVAIAFLANDLAFAIPEKIYHIAWPFRTKSSPRGTTPRPIVKWSLSRSRSTTLSGNFWS